MSLTQEQIKTLKKGDTVLVEARVDHVSATGCSVSHGCISHSLPFSNLYPVPVSPKYDPCRPFREGDVVRFMKVNGNNARCRYNGVEIKEGSLGRIVKKEGRNCFWVEFDVHHNWCLDAAYFELITPVEELKPYEVTESSDYYGVDKDDLEVEAAIFWKKSHPNAKAAAEAERDRLNAEWRKEHGNGH